MSARILFRCDASPSLGGGHVMRCLTLARELARTGAEITFATAGGAADSVPALARSGFALLELDDPHDSTELLARLPERLDLLVVDHYGLDAAFERALRPIAERILVIDDLADRAHACDVLVDQNFGREALDYRDLVCDGTRILAGAQYALLRPEFAAARPAALERRTRTKGVARILVSMGMTDIGGVTERVLSAVLAADTGAAVDVVLGSAAPSLEAVRAIAAERDDVALHVDSADMGALMTRADLAIGAAGSTSWERCCLGLPSIVLVLAENQREIALRLDAAGILAAVSSVEEIRASVHDIVRDPDRLHAMSALAASVTDGRGTARVGTLAVPTDGERVDDLVLRPAAPADAETLWKWRNEPDARAAFLSSDAVPWAEHLAWLGRRLADRNTMLCIGERHGMPVGTIRFDRGLDESAEISINVDASRRGSGIATALLDAGCARAHEAGFASRVTAAVRRSNRASLRAFQSGGFDIAEDDGEMVHLEKAMGDRR